MKSFAPSTHSHSSRREQYSAWYAHSKDARFSITWTCAPSLCPDTMSRERCDFSASPFLQTMRQYRVASNRQPRPRWLHNSSGSCIQIQSRSQAESRVESALCSWSGYDFPQRTGVFRESSDCYQSLIPLGKLKLFLLLMICRDLAWSLRTVHTRSITHCPGCFPRLLLVNIVLADWRDGG